MPAFSALRQQFNFKLFGTARWGSWSAYVNNIAANKQIEYPNDDNMGRINSLQ